MALVWLLPTWCVTIHILLLIYYMLMMLIIIVIVIVALFRFYCLVLPDTNCKYRRREFIKALLILILKKSKRTDY